MSTQYLSIAIALMGCAFYATEYPRIAGFCFIFSSLGFWLIGITGGCETTKNTGAPR